MTEFMEAFGICLGLWLVGYIILDVSAWANLVKRVLNSGK